MTNYVYVGTSGGVDVKNTAQLLRDYNAIWCPPTNVIRWNVQDQPKENDRIWLIWANQLPTFDPPFLLGGGNLMKASRVRFGSEMLWSNADAPGIRPAAERLGYRGPTSMSFLRVDRLGERSDVCLPGPVYPQVHNFRVPPYSGLTQLDADGEKILQTTWPLQ